MNEQFVCYHTGCNKVYNSKYNLVRHINTNHLMILKYVCQICSRKFPHRQNLACHEKAHKRSEFKQAVSEDSVLHEFLLSEHISALDAAKQPSQKPSQGLPPVSAQRQEMQLNQHIPVMPIMLPDSSSPLP